MPDELIAEVLPGLYRSVLDAVAALEANGRRHDAAVLRADATRIYSRAWNPAAARRLRALLARGERLGETGRRSLRERLRDAAARHLDVERLGA